MRRVAYLLVVAVAFLAGIATGCWTDDWFDIDTCYDRGGYYDRAKETCIY